MTKGIARKQTTTQTQHEKRSFIYSLLALLLCALLLPTTADAQAPQTQVRPTTRPASTPAQAPQARKKNIVRNSPGPKRKAWPLQTRIPFAISLGGGVALVVTGLILQSSQNTIAPALVSGGVSWLFTASSSLMWWHPTPLKGVLGVLLAATALTGGIVILAGVGELNPAYGWGLLASLPVHLTFSIVGWLNYHRTPKYKRPKPQKRRRRNPYRRRNSTPTTLGTW